MNFRHPCVNEYFGFQKDIIIPFMCIDNPIVYIEKAQNSMRENGENAAWDEAELKGIL